VRVFLAVDPGDACRHSIAGVVDSLRTTTSGVRWIREANLHLTMAFLGEVDESRLPEIFAATATVARRHGPFSATISGSGAFPDWHRVRVVWLGLRDAGSMVLLGSDLGEMCTRLGFPQRPFRAHLTLGRTTGPLSAEQKVTLRKALALHKTAAYQFAVSRVLVMKSALSPAGSVYSELASFPLGET
jgi:RNA 2',3'-cyclic 3'-phosphodiesterase